MKFFNLRFNLGGRGGMVGWRRGFYLGSLMFAAERTTIVSMGETYLTRWLLYVGKGTLRLHKFYRGDNDSASHTHPWPFITFPLTGYFEKVFNKGTEIATRYVRPFRFHYRPAGFEHYVMFGCKWAGDYGGWEILKKPFYTLVITGGKQPEEWGFYPEPGKFIYWKEYHGNNTDITN